MHPDLVCILVNIIIVIVKFIVNIIIVIVYIIITVILILILMFAIVATFARKISSFLVEAWVEQLLKMTF